MDPQLPHNGKRVAISQSNYIPWIGYFDLIQKANVFVFLDDVQYTKSDWRNRNRIKTDVGPLWLTIPCGVGINRLICEVQIESKHWQQKHWKTIQQYYHRAPFYEMGASFFKNVYLDRVWTNLSELNQYLIQAISKQFLDIHTGFLDSRHFQCTYKKQERILEILEKIGGVSEYLSGPKASDYLDESEFIKRNMVLTFMDYSGYPPYKQLYGDFIRRMSILDLIFNLGPAASDYMKRLKQPSSPDIGQIEPCKKKS